MFGGRRMDSLEREMSLFRIDLCDKVGLKAWLDALNAHTTALNDTRKRIDSLAAALGYKWKPEGKTEARWERNDSPFASAFRCGPDPHLLSKVFGEYVPTPPHNRRKGDKKKRGGK